MKREPAAEAQTGHLASSIAETGEESRLDSARELGRQGEATARAAKARRNRAQHARSKASQEHILLRLQIGDRAAIDGAAEAAGLSRAAYGQLYLVPLSRALTPARIAKLAELGAEQGLSLSSVIARLIDSAPARQAEPAALAAAEFDALFSPGL